MFKFVPQNISGAEFQTHIFTCIYTTFHPASSSLLRLFHLPWVPIVSYHMNHIGKCDEFECTTRVGVGRSDDSWGHWNTAPGIQFNKWKNANWISFSDRLKDNAKILYPHRQNALPEIVWNSTLFATWSATQRGPIKVQEADNPILFRTLDMIGNKWTLAGRKWKSAGKERMCSSPLSHNCWNPKSSNKSGEQLEGTKVNKSFVTHVAGDTQEQIKSCVTEINLITIIIQENLQIKGS